MLLKLQIEGRAAKTKKYILIVNLKWALYQKKKTYQKAIQ